MDKRCVYYKHDVLVEDYGWGWSVADYIVLWHCECFEMAEGVPVA